MTKRMSDSDASNPLKSPVTPKLAEILGKSAEELNILWRSLGQMSDMEIDMETAYGQTLTLEEYREKAAMIAMRHYAPHVSNSRYKVVLVYMWLLKHQGRLMAPIINHPATYTDIGDALNKDSSEALRLALRGKILPDG